MTPADLIPIIREDFLDESPDSSGATPDDAYHWRTPFLLREINNAQREACRRQDLRHIRDESTPTICSVTVTAGVSDYPLDARILRIESIRATIPAIGGTMLRHVTVEQLDSIGPWRLWPSGIPRYFMIIGRSLRLVPTPAIGDTLTLSVWREPLVSAGLGDELEWPGDHLKLCHWVAARAFMRPNEDSFRADLGKLQMVQFDQAVGAPVPAQVMAELLRDPPRISFMSSGHQQNRSCGRCNDGASY